MKIKDIKYGTSGIYKMVLNNGKIYIGLSNDIRRRMNEHLNKDLKEHPELPINRAVIKYGLKDIEILEEIDANNREYLVEREKYWIAHYDSYNNLKIGYNLTQGGDGSSQGTENSASYLSQTQVDEIFNLLLKSTLTYDEIAEKVGCSHSIVTRINTGQHYRNNNFQYPLREKRLSRFGIENKTSAFYNNPEKLEAIINDLKNSDLTQQEIAKKYNLGKSTIADINYGRRYSQENETYPLRPVRKNCSHKKIISNEDLLKIKEMLLNSPLSMKKIGEQFNLSLDIISEINLGKRQKNEDWTYPIRNPRSRKR